MSTRKKSVCRRGVASIPIVLAFGILIIAIAVGLAAISSTEIFVTQGSYQSARALQYAEAGARDALERIARNKNYTCASVDCYSVDMASSGCSANSACAKVSVSAGVGSGANPKIITSKGQAGVHVRRLQVSVEFDASLDGRIATTSWSEITQ